MTSPLEIHVLCRSEEYDARWARHAEAHPDARIRRHADYDSYYRFLLDVVRETTQPYVVACHDDVWLGAGFAERVHRLAADLDQNVFNWGVAGNAGVTPDGLRYYRYLKDPHGAFHRSLYPKPVLGVDGNVMLINAHAFKQEGVEYPDLGGFHGYDTALCLEALRAGLLPVVDHRLAVFHESGGSMGGVAHFLRSKPFEDYFRSRFINHAFAGTNVSRIEIAQDMRYLQPEEGDRRQDIRELFDRAVDAARGGRPPSLILCVRTQLTRPALLARTLLSCAAMSLRASEKARLSALVVSDRPLEELDAALAELQPLVPGLELGGLAAPVRPGRHSRADLLFHAIEQCGADYIWFVDDDDFVYPSALDAVARALPLTGHALVTGDVRWHEEVWDDAADISSLHPAASKPGKRFWGTDAFKLLEGDNHVPICGAVFPVEPMRRRLAALPWRGDYYEDYFLLLLALGSPEIEVVPTSTLMCGVSIRAGENTVIEKDRSHWNMSFATFLGEWMDAPELFPAGAWAAYHDLLGRENKRRRGLPFLARLGMRAGLALTLAARLLRHPGVATGLLAKGWDMYRRQGLRALLTRAQRWAER